MSIRVPFILFAGIIACIAGCQMGTQATMSEMDHLTDSLITISRLNENTILVSFDGEAITAVNTSLGIVVVDAGIGTYLTNRYRKVLEKEFGRNDVSFLMLTHGHHDHFGGSAVFNDASLIAHDSYREAVISRWKYPEKVKMNLQNIIREYQMAMDTLPERSVEWIENFEYKVRFQSAYDDIMNHRDAKKPDLTFSDTLSVQSGEIHFDMIWFGKAHSASDILIHSPELKILFTGDLFTKYGRPSLDKPEEMDHVRFEYVKKWVFARIESIEIIVGGHGQLLLPEDLTAFFRKLQAQI